MADLIECTRCGQWAAPGGRCRDCGRVLNPPAPITLTHVCPAGCCRTCGTCNDPLCTGGAA